MKNKLIVLAEETYIQGFNDAVWCIEKIQQDKFLPAEKRLLIQSLKNGIKQARKNFKNEK